jgi:hypothetical protein
MALAARGAGFFAGEFMRMPALVGGSAPQAGNLALALGVHRREAAKAPALAGGSALGALVGGVLQRHIGSFRFWLEASTYGKVRARQFSSAIRVATERSRVLGGKYCGKRT